MNMISIVPGKRREGLAGVLQMGLVFASCIVLTWLVALVCFRVHTNRSTSSMILLLAVLMVATLGNSLLALLTAVSASLAFSWYFIDVVGSLAITTVQGGITFFTMSVTALVGSQLSIRSERRAQEAIRRREEMERLQQLGSVMLGAVTVAEAASRTVRKLVVLFGLEGAVLRIDGETQVFQDGAFQDRASQDRALQDRSAASISIVPLNAGNRTDLLELYGEQPSPEVRSALASMISLVIERARSSEEKAKVSATQRGEELRSTVLNALAHNFKTPLTSIKAAASVLRTSKQLNGALAEQELAVIIDEEADRLDQLITESLDLERIETHRANPRREECHIAEVVRSATARVTGYLGKRELVIDVAEDLPTLMADKFLLDQMLLQVVDNAGKYSRPGSTIRISAVQADATIVISVQNEGSEIPASERQLIFDKFYRGIKNRTTTEGTGLGLAIAKTIAEAYHGKLWLDAEPLGRYSDLHFLWRWTKGPRKGQMITNRTILLIDDEPQIRRVLRASLMAQRANILDAENGEEGLELLRLHTVDVVLLDLNMPGMGGLKTCRAIRAAWDVPIIVLSVRDSDADKIEALDAGADDYLAKPFSFDELMARVRAALRRSGFATDTAPKTVSVPNLEIDFALRRVVANGQVVRLTPTEFDILRYLVSQANKPVPHRRLLQAIWGPESGDQIEYLRVFINQLRKKIEPPGSKPTFIATEPRIGYRFVLEPAPGA